MIIQSQTGKFNQVKKNGSNLIQIDEESSISSSNTRQVDTNQPHIPQSEVGNTLTYEPIAA